MVPSFVLALVGFGCYLAMAPVVVNGDGLGYLKAAMTGSLYPGHVAYVPLLALLAKLTHATRPIALLWPARLCSAASAATAALALAATARRRFGDGAATAATAGLLASWGALAAGSDVETYAPALAALTLALSFADAERPVAAGFAVAAAALFHVENVLFGLPLLLLLPDGRARSRFVAAAALPVAAIYGQLIAHKGIHWLFGASHGLGYPLHWYTPGVAIYGACKALVYAPYPYEASSLRVAVAFAVGLAAAVALATCMRRPLPRTVVAAWVVPYALVAVRFFGSDAERWTFLLPLAWLAAAARPRRAVVLAALIAAANVALWLPAARDARFRDRAVAAAGHLAPGDLVIGPGHGWDEYLGFYDRSGVTPLPLIYDAGAYGAAALPQAIADAVAEARAAGHRVYLARLVDDGDPAGWKELVQFGITPANARRLLPPGHAVAVGDGLERWDP